MLYIISETGEIKNKVQFDMDKYQIPEKSIYNYSIFEKYKKQILFSILKKVLFQQIIFI